MCGGGDDTISTRLKYMVDGHRELPLVNNVTSPVGGGGVGGGWRRRWKGRLIYVVEAGLGSELGAVSVEIV
jgi:hypothetical protein